MLALGFSLSAAVAARAETRTLKLYFIHTKERAEITFKRNGRYDQAGLKKINRFLRDWRRNEPARMDPRLLDLVWETYRASGARDYIHVVSAYRSPATNSMLRSRSKGVAEKSQHMLGKALDFYIPGVPLRKLRDSGLRMQVGGVGYYPRSGSPFVHLDVGNVRHWPRMSRKELVSVFPSGKTLHVPSDGKPLPGYQTALASYQSRKKSGATALALAGSGRSGRGLLSALFGGGADEEEDRGEVAVAARASKDAAAKVKVAQPEVVAQPAAVAQPEVAVPVPTEEPRGETPEAIIAALPARSVPLPLFAPRPKAEVGEVETVAGIPVAAPADVPFGAAAALAEDPEGLALAANIPLPSWRPDSPPAAAEVAEDVEGSDVAKPVLLAMAEAPVNAARSITIGAPLPESRPTIAGETENEPYSVAGLPVAATALEAEVMEGKARLAVLSTGATRATAVQPATRDRLAIGVGARTTAKSARARPKDTRPDPKPLVLAAQPEAVRWALSDDGFVDAADARPAAAPPIARELVRKAPSKVYATGFQQAAAVADAGRFSGKAVSFMPIARFETN
jgi:uncharacterized protein YcbK (DUF882 family)